VSDESEIAALVHRYAFLLDAGDVDAVAALFEDATWRSDRSDVVRRGAAEVRPVYEQLVSTADAAGTRHLISDLVVTIGPDAGSASARCHWTVLQADDGHPAAGNLSGRYVDRFTKVRGRWRFADRLITTDPGGSPNSAAPDLG
jgi:ketosteroid isomerase-like protein